MHYLRVHNGHVLASPTLFGRRIVLALNHSSDGEWAHNDKVVRLGIVPSMIPAHGAATVTCVAGAYCLHLCWQVVS